MSELPEADLRATDEVLHDLQRNFELRRLLLVALHVLVPAFILTGVKMAAQNAPPEGLSLVWEHSLPLAAIGVVVSSLLVAHGMTRCQHGIVVNGAIINWRIYGHDVDRKLNWQGVSTGFFLLSVLSGVFGLSIAVYCTVAGLFQLDGVGVAGVVAAACVILVAIACSWLSSRHKHAWQCAVAMIQSEKESAKTDAACRQLHRINSLDDTNSDIGVVFVTAMVLFSTMLTTLPELSDVSKGRLPQGVATSIVQYGHAVVAVYAVLVMCLSQSMIIRLRVAMAEHSSQSDAGLASASARVWKPGFYERTSMLFIMLAVMLVIFAMLLCLSFFQLPIVAIGFALAYLVTSRLILICEMRRELQRYCEKWPDTLIAQRYVARS